MEDVTIEDVTFTYSGGTKPAIQNINLKIESGEIMMITGPSGAGKTTLCRLLNGFVPHFFRGKFVGNVIVKNNNTRKSTISFLSRIVGYLFQDPSSQLICPSVEEEVAFGAENYGVPPDEIRRRVDENMKATRIEKYRGQNPHRLSGGEQQACALASIMTMRPQIYVLDEPTSNLDPIGSEIILNLITSLAKREKHTMLIVEHKMEELFPFVDRVIVMNEGKVILDDEPREIIKDVELMEKIGLKPPQVSLLAHKLKKYYPQIPIPLTLDEAVKIFSEMLDKLKTGRKLKQTFHKFHKEETQKPRSEPIIKTQDLWHTYPEGTVALKGVSIEIYPGEFIAIIGQNGSGKTTLVKHFNGLLKPTKGKVYVYGVDTTTVSVAKLSRRVGYCFQNPDFQLCCRTVKDELEFGPKNLKLPEEEREKRVREIAKTLGFEGRLKEPPFSLSKGERQKLAVGSVLAMEPDVLIVDEPTTGQDYKTGKEMMEFYKRLNNEGKTIIIITHDMNLAAEYAERTIVLKDGKVLLDGPTREVYSKTKELQATYLRPPQVTRLFQKLAEYDLPPDVLTVDEALDYMTKLVESG